MSDYEVLEVPNVQLQRGGLLPMARLAYKTLGTLSPARDNAVLVSTWYTGTHNDIETFMVGEGRALDPRKYFIVMTNLLGNGLSSSPSNSPPPNERGRFPKVTIHDNVRLQQILLTQKLGLARIRLVTAPRAQSQARPERRHSTKSSCSRCSAHSNWIRSSRVVSMSGLPSMG